MPTISTAARHGLQAVTEAILLALVLTALAFGAAVATRSDPAGAVGARAATTGSSSIALATVGGARAASIMPSLGQEVTFTTSYPKTIKNPRILVNCYQGGELVFGMGGSVTYAFQLGGSGSVWLTNGGAASCEALLFYFGKDAGKQTFNVLARTTFDAGG